MRAPARSVAALAATALVAWSGADAATLIHAGRLIDGLSGQPAGPSTIVVEGERIVAVEAGHRAPGPEDRVIDLSGATVLPGLMDMHTHVSQENRRDSYL